MSAMPKPALSVEGRVRVLEGRSVDEIARLNLYYTQSAAMFEYDGAMVQDLLTQLLKLLLFWALAHIDAPKAAVMEQPRSDEVSAGMGASNATMVAVERPRNFGDCDGFCAGELEVAMVLDVMVQPSPTCN